MNRISSFFKNIIRISELNSSHYKACLNLFGCILFFLSVLNLSLVIRETSSTKGIIYSTDNDAGRAIQTVQLTRWYNSNHFAPYGNLYFRFAHTIASFSPKLNQPGWSEAENEDIRHHFALTLTSLLSLAALSFLLAYLVLGNFTASLFAGNLLFHITLHDSTWMQFLFRAHPDHLLMLATASASTFTLFYAHNPTEKNFTRSALLWGTATAVKSATILFIPSFLFLFLSEGVNKRTIQKGLRFIGYMLIAYLILGFPQNFGFYKHIKFLLHESKSSRAGDLDSASNYILLLFSQTRWLILSFIPLHLLFGKKERLITLRFLGFVFIAIIVLISRRMLMPETHHPMPFAALILVTAIYLLKLIPPIQFKYKQVVLIVSSLIGLSFLSNYSKVFIEQKEKQLSCREESFQVLTLIKEIQKDSSLLLLREPYFPFETGNEQTKQIWGIDFEDIDNIDPGLFGTKKSFGQQYLIDYPNDPNKTKEEWDRNRDFYKKVLFDNSFTTPEGRVFKKIHEDQCGFMLWQKVD